MPLVNDDTDTYSDLEFIIKIQSHVLYAAFETGSYDFVSYSLSSS